MNANELIIHTAETKLYETMAKRALWYAIRSVPFTVNRMNIKLLERRIVNIAKGKLAEYLFFDFAILSGLMVDTLYTATPFWQTDNSDFVWDQRLWDIKNNFVYCNPLSVSDVLEFFALVPDRHNKDQWALRYDNKLPEIAPKGKAFLFTFMLKGRNKDIISINLSEKQRKILLYFTQKYKGQPQSCEPEAFSDVVKQNFQDLKFSLNINSPLFITAYSTESHFALFRKIEKNTTFKTEKHCFTSRIANRGTEIKNLPSFKSLLK